MSSVVAHLFWHELKRILHPTRVLPLLGLAMILSYREVEGPVQSNVAQLQGALTLHNFWLTLVVPVVAGAAAGSLAADRRSGLTLTVLSKGVSRGRYLLSKILGAAASGGLITLAAIAGFYVMVAILWPSGRVTLEANQWAPEPVRRLYIWNPLAHDMLIASMHVAASAALPLVGVLAGTLVANEYVAMAAPPLFAILATVVFRHVFEPLSPEVYLSLDYGMMIPGWLRPATPYLYWLGLAALTSALCQWIFAKKELT